MRSWTARGVGISCALVATGLGLLYLAVAGAPTAYLAIQSAALAIGLVSLAIFARIPVGLPQHASGPLLLLLGLALLATALLAPSVDGAARWVKLGAIYVQTSLVLLPAILLLFARAATPMGALAMVVTALALALQPDRAMAGALAAALAALALAQPNRSTLVAAAGGLGAFGAALLQPDTLPAVPFVDGILYSAFDLHPLMGAAVIGGAATLILPAFGRGERGPRVVFGATWLTIVAAAALGNYPTPLVGYGGSAVLGYLLSVALLPGAPRMPAAKPAAASVLREPNNRDELLRTATARARLRAA